MVHRRCVDQSVDDDDELVRIGGASNLIEQRQTGDAIGRSVSKEQREKCLELPGRVVAPRLILGKRQAQKEQSAVLEAVGTKSDLLERPNQVAPHVALNRTQIVDSVEGAFDLLRNDLRVDFGQG